MTDVPPPRNAASASALSAETAADLGLGLCVCFDMDGLLVNTEPMWWHAEATLMTDYGGQWTDDDGRECVGGPLEKVADLIIRRTGRGTVEDIIERLIGSMVQLIRSSEVALMPGARELLAQCRDAGCRVALVSASPRILVDAVLLSLGQAGEVFEFTVSCDDVEISKPDPAPYLLAAAKFGGVPTEMVVLEDSPTGVASALAAGARVIAVPHLAPIEPGARLTVVDSLTAVSVASLTDRELA